MFEKYWENAVRIWNFIWGLLGLLLQVGASLGITAMGWVGVVLAFAVMLVGYVVVGAILEKWLVWAWRKRPLGLLTLIAWVPAAVFCVALIGAAPLTLGWLRNVPAAAYVGGLALVISIIINAVANPLDRPLNWLSRRRGTNERTLRDQARVYYGPGSRPTNQDLPAGTRIRIFATRTVGGVNWGKISFFGRWIKMAHVV